MRHGGTTFVINHVTLRVFVLFVGGYLGTRDNTGEQRLNGCRKAQPNFDVQCAVMRRAMFKEADRDDEDMLDVVLAQTCTSIVRNYARKG